MGDVALAVERAENKTENLRAKASAIDELAESGVLDDQLSPGGSDPLSRELAQLTASQNVEDELEALRLSAPGGQSGRKQLTASQEVEDELAALRRSR